MSFRWRPRRLISSHAWLVGRRLAAGAALLTLAAGCLDDQPTAGRVPDGAARLGLRAQITGAQAESYDVRVRVYYERTGGTEVAIPVSPAVLTVAGGTSSTETLSLQVAPCFADESREGAPGCALHVELALLDETGGVLSRDTRTALLERPGVTVNVEGFTLPAAALTVDRTTLVFSAVQGAAAPPAQTITVGSNTGAELALGVSVASGTAPFLSATLTTSTAEGGVVSVVPTRTDLEPGSYTATVGITSGRASIPLQNVAVTYTVAPTGNGVVYGRVLDAATSQPIAGVTVRLNPTGVTTPTEIRTVVTGADGRYEITALASGRTYEIVAERDGYTSNAAHAVQLTGANDAVLANFSLPAAGNTRRTGTLTGRVVAAATGAPIADATVLISGGPLTNGVFLTTTTDARGNFALDAVGLDAPGGVPIPTFTVSATAPGFTPAAQAMTVTQNVTTANLRFELAPAGNVASYLREGFETTPAWTVSGYWTRIDLANTNVVNTAYPTYVSLAPGDASNGALPDAAEGSFAFWYGRPQTGNFLGTQSPGDPAGSGGTSVEEHEGTLTSPPFAIPADVPAAALTFQTWFEIESVNPNQEGFDYMEVYVQSGQAAPVMLGRLNPFQNPQLEPRDMIPFTSGGFNRPPQWRPAQFDLSAYRGQTVRLLFRFETRDTFYNGFRGWLIDDVRVTNEVVIPGVQGSRASGGAGPVLRRSGPPRSPRRPR